MRLNRIGPRITPITRIKRERKNTTQGPESCLFVRFVGRTLLGGETLLLGSTMERRSTVLTSIIPPVIVFCPVLKSRVSRSLRVTFLGLAVNMLLSGVKFAAGIAGHSHALIADAVESLADVFSSLVVWRAIVIAATPADEDHPYGHGKAEPLAAAVVSTMLLLASGWIVVQAIGEILQPHQTPRPFTLLVLLVTVLIKEGLFRFVLREALSVESSAVHSDAWHHRSDAVTSLAAAVGISVAVIGGKGYESADDVAAILAAAIIAWNGWRLLRPALSELMDTAPPPDVVERIRQIAATIPGVEQVEKCIVRKMGYYFYADMHVEVDPQMTVQHAHEIAHQVKDKVRDNFGRVRDVLVHIEPARNSDCPPASTQKQPEQNRGPRSNP
jgi:cation diffusion facilitator family transporter